MCIILKRKLLQKPKIANIAEEKFISMLTDLWCFVFFFFGHATRLVGS